MMSAGDLNRTIRFIGANAAQDEFGQPVETPVVLRSARAQRVSLRIADMQRGQLTSEVAEAKFLTRYMEGVTTGMVIREGTTDYAIIAVDEIGVREGLAITCKVAR